MFRLLKVVITALCLAVMVSGVSAQAIGVLTSGSGQFGSLSPQSPIGLFTFQASEGDLAQISLIGLQPGMNLSASLQSPSQQGVGTSQPDPGIGADAQINALLPATGTYSVLVGGNAGDFIITLNLVPTANAGVLFTGSPQSVSFFGGQGSVSTFSGTQGSPLAVTLTSNEGTLYNAAVFNVQGQIAGTARALTQACFVLPPSANEYTLVVTGLNADAFGTVNVSFGTGCGGSAPAPQQQPQQPVQPPAATQQVSPPVGQTSPTVCTAFSGGAVNIRSGAGTEFGVLGQLQPGAGVPVTGITSNGWLQVQSQFGTGFVSQSVVSLSGPCGSLPLVQSPAGPAQPQPQPTVPGPAVTEQPLGPTATYTPTQPGPTPTYTPTTPLIPTDTPTVPVPTAPPDSNYVLVVPLDSTVSITDYVSFPGGDVEDVVSYDTSGLNPNSALPGGIATLTFSFSCFGTGTQFINFRVDGNDRPCGGTYTRNSVNAQSDTGAVRITATGGTNTYVQWVITATLTRNN
jgi:hypothetical protein